MKKLLTIAVAGAVLGSAGASANVSDAEWAAFQKDYAALVERVNALAAENAELKASADDCCNGGVAVEDLEAAKADIAALQAQNAASSWAERVKLKGDFRYRYETYEEDRKDLERDRQRVRARIAAAIDLGNDLELGIGLASGDNDSPTSGNQTLEGDNSDKNIWLDTAYAKWTPGDYYVQAGKTKNPFYAPQKNGLILDGDVRPEGFGAGYAKDGFFARANVNYLNSDKREIDGDTVEDDLVIWGVQAGATFADMLTLAVGYHDIPVEGESFVLGSAKGNTGDGVYNYNYELLNVGAELALSAGDLPLVLWADYVKNNDADDYDTGYIVGAKLGKAKKQGTWQLAYQYQELEADAVLGSLTDSDFAGGGTDNKGHKISFGYALSDKWVWGLNYFDNTTGIDLGGDEDYKKFQSDLKFKF